MSTWLAGPLFPILAESGEAYYSTPAGWVDVLVDCPGAQGLFTYCLPAGMTAQPGDILSVPFGAQQVGAIAIACHRCPPTHLDTTRLREVEAVIHPGFFPANYWALLQQVADYYFTPLIQVVRVALPPGLLARSRRRVRLVEKSSEGDEAGGRRPEANIRTQNSKLKLQNFPHSAPAQQILQLLQSSKTGDFSWQHLQRQVRGASQGLQELLKQGWVESYLEPPEPPRPKLRQAVTLVPAPTLFDLTPRQQEILGVLRRQGGEMWLSDLLQMCHASSTTLKALAAKGCLIIQPQEVLRSEQAGTIAADRPKPLTPDQAIALAQIQKLEGFAQVLLHGVTGSGKTEVYLQAIAPILERGQSALVLVPEIGLTPQLTDRFRARFGNQVCVYHSALSDGERYDTWRQMLSDRPQIVIGTRSAIFAPLPRLGMIILDEEHDSSFKQDQPAPCYHACTVARWRAELENCPLILGSATPSLESWVNIRGQEGERREKKEEKGKKAGVHSEFRTQTSSSHLSVHPSTPYPPSPSPHSLYLPLPQRIHARPMPPIEVVDMRQELHEGNASIFSRSLQAALRTLQERNQQGILFIHRRGHSTFVSCRSCGYVVTCPNCDVSLAYHHVHADAQPLLRCHYCNYIQNLPKTCPTCDSIYFKHFGSGTQRVVQELARHFPELRAIRFDSDTTRTKGSHRALLTQFAQGEADLLIGTQMLTKGIDLPQVTLVGIVAADGLLHFSDYRASERTFQTLTQVAGRSGRGNDPGRVILQTYSPEHPVIEAVQRQDYEAFANAELAHRISLNYPPCGRLILFRFSSPHPMAVQKAAERVATALSSLEATGVERLGPAPATILRVANRYRWQILLKFPTETTVNLPDLSELRALCPREVSLTVDVDPLHLL
ncbi:primosomal protein N' [Leptothermofonsia sp. ETS-13]|uniref:primosomal protein N' n=1 Tax=Leptothermofonsia sp. ETS-13 TaxID=3035696 RepID=UPI003BA199EB